jgi:putative membrane-bound dehydrogenase-like protein
MGRAIRRERAPACHPTDLNDGTTLMPRFRLRRALPVALLVCLATTAVAHAAMPKVPDGFKIRLVAAVPAVQFPCQVATDPSGGLYIAEDPMDQIGPADKPIDRILLFKDGKEPVVFAEKLNAVFGMVWNDGNLYVMNMPNLTVLRDTDGDGKADERKELFHDLGLPAGQPNNFNDHIVSGLQIGIDGYLYISVGDKGVPKATGPDGRTAQVFGGGILRCRLDGNGLEVFSNGTRNHLEPNLDERDNLFTYDNTDDGLGWWTRVTHHVDGGYYGYPWDYHDRLDRMINRIEEYGGGSPCGGLVYKEDAWPEKYRGRAFWTEWAKRNVRAFRFKEKGASFAVEDVEDFIVPGDVGDFRPLDLALSYDGKTMYVADWGYGGWANKTEKLGRVYAVTYEGKIEQKPRGKDSDSVINLIRALDHPSFNERVRAQNALIKKGKSALYPISVALNHSQVPALHRRHLVWALDGIAGGTPAATGPLVEALKAPFPDVRAQAARALGERSVATALKPLLALLKDDDPTVRLQAIVALGRIGKSEAIPALLPIVADTDPYLAYSARTALRRINDWKAADAGLDAADARIRAGTMLAMEMTYDLDAASALAKFAADPGRDPSERARAVFLLAQGHRRPIPWDGKWWGTQPAKTARPVKSIDWPGTTLVLNAVRGLLTDPSVPVRLAAVLAVRDERDRDALPALRERFTAETETKVRGEVAKTLGVLGDREALPLLTAALRDKATPDPVRDESLSAIEVIASDEALKALLTLLQENTLGVEREPRVVAALGRFKSKDAVAALLKVLASPSSSVRKAAAEALGKSSDAKTAGAPVRELLADKTPDVRKAAASALGALKDRGSIPALIEASYAADTRFEATLALADVPDVRALSIYLHGLADKSPEIRRDSSRAVAHIRDEAAPILEQLAARKELPSTALAELRKIYTRTRPLRDWHVVGPFPMKTEPPFPIEKSGAVDFKAKFSGFRDDPLAWKTTRAIDNHGQVDLGKLYSNDDDVAVFGVATFESPNERKAEFAVGSDDTLTVWLNGEKVYDFQNRRGYQAEESRFDAPVLKGKNHVVIKCGNNGGGWQYSVAVAYPSDYVFLKGPLPGAFDPEAFRKFAQSAKGKVEHGRALFTDLKGLACVKCHTVGGQGGQVGPELSSVGVKYPKDEIITSILYPSAKISSGYEPVVIATADGKVVTGIVKGETADAIEVEDGEAKRIRILKSDIDERKRSEVSLMPNGLAEGLSREDFADLIAYLETLKDKPAEPAKTGGGR